MGLNPVLSIETQVWSRRSCPPAQQAVPKPDTYDVAQDRFSVWLGGGGAMRRRASARLRRQKRPPASASEARRGAGPENSRRSKTLCELRGMRALLTHTVITSDVFPRKVHVGVRMQNLNFRKQVPEVLPKFVPGPAGSLTPPSKLPPTRVRGPRMHAGGAAAESFSAWLPYACR